MQRQTLQCTSSPQQLDIHAYRSLRRLPRKKVGQVHFKSPQKHRRQRHLNASKRVLFRGGGENSVSFKLPRPLFPSCGVSSPVVPGLKALQSRRWSEIEEPPPAADRRLSPRALPLVHTRRALGYRAPRPRTHSSLSRENLSNKLWPSGTGFAGAAILPYARWFTEICGWGDVWRHVRAWASTEGPELRFFFLHSAECTPLRAQNKVCSKYIYQQIWCTLFILHF